MELVQEAGIKWSIMLEEGVSAVYSNGVSVLYGWAHMRHRKITYNMTVRSQLVCLAMMILKLCNTGILSR